MIAALFVETQGVYFGLPAPRCKVPHMGMLEAALLAEYGRRQLVGAKGGAA